MGRGSMGPGQSKRRTGNSIKAGHFFFFGFFGRAIQALSALAVLRHRSARRAMLQGLLLAVPARERRALSTS